jgi:hypothetical protein
LLNSTSITHKTAIATHAARICFISFVLGNGAKDVGFDTDRNTEKANKNKEIYERVAIVSQLQARRIGKTKSLTVRAAPPTNRAKPTGVICAVPALSALAGEWLHGEPMS